MDWEGKAAAAASASSTTTHRGEEKKRERNTNDIQLNQFEKFGNSLFGIRFSKYIRHVFYSVES